MGWNSWNSFATTLTEAQARETAAIQAAKLLPSGYDVFTIDIQWYEPEAKSYEYNRAPQPAMDGYGRLLPAPNRFPSSINGAGFKPLADDIHRLGLKFGVHLMRGIPRAAVEKNLPVFGTQFTARDIADTTSTCPWNPDMYGVDMRRPGAQAYYDSVFALFASWGVDFVKMDDMSRPTTRTRPRSRPRTAPSRPASGPCCSASHPARRPCPAPSTCAALRRCGASVTTSGTSGPCSTPSSPASKTGTPTVAPAPGPTPTCSPRPPGPRRARQPLHQG